MVQPRGILTPEEQARIIELQDLLIERFVDQEKRWQKGKRLESRQWRPKSTVFCAKRKRLRNGRL